jgi:hypothetical protein
MTFEDDFPSLKDKVNTRHNGFNTDNIDYWNVEIVDIKENCLDKVRVREAIREARDSSGYLGIGEWETDRDIELFNQFLDLFEKKLGIAEK